MTTLRHGRRRRSWLVAAPDPAPFPLFGLAFEGPIPTLAQWGLPIASEAA